MPTRLKLLSSSLSRRQFLQGSLLLAGSTLTGCGSGSERSDVSRVPYWFKSLGNGQNSGYLPAMANAIGEKSWEALLTGSLTPPTLGADGTLYLGSTLGSAVSELHFFALSPTGALKWKYPLDSYYVSSAAAVSPDGTSYFRISRWGDPNKFLALSSTGEKKWELSVGRDRTTFESPTLGEDGTVYLAGTNRFFYAINPDGSQKWRFEAGDLIDFSPAVAADGTLYFGAWDNYLYALDPGGTLRWKAEVPWSGEGKIALGPDGTIYAGSTTEGLRAIRPDGTLKWTYETDYSVYFTPAIGPDGTIYVIPGEPYLLALHPNGTKKWQSARLGFFTPPSIGRGGTLYLVAELGLETKLYALTPQGTVKWVLPLDGRLSYGSSPTLALDGSIYLGLEDGQLYAIG